MEKRNKKYYLKDESLVGVDDDFFRHQDIANNVKKIIDNNTSPFNIAIIGKWGLGKSSLINMIVNPMRNNPEKYLVREINAWKYEKDEIGKALLKEIWQGISGKRMLTYDVFQREFDRFVDKENKSVKNKKEKDINICYLLKASALIFVISVIFFCIYKGIYLVHNDQWSGWCNYWGTCFLGYCENMSKLFVLPLLVWFGKLYMDRISSKDSGKYEIKFPLETKADYEIYTQNLLDDFAKNKPHAKIVIVIDDLDRLSPNKIVDALDALKLFMSYKQCVFIVPFDDEILKKALDKKRIDGLSLDETQYQSEMILDKLFQYKIYMPQLIKNDMRTYAVNICKEHCKDFINEYCDEKCFEKIIRKILIHSSVTTPRQVKKIINAFIQNLMIASDREHAGKVQKGVASSESGKMILAKISVLQADFNEFYDLLFIDSNLIANLLMVYRDKNLKPTGLVSDFFEEIEGEFIIKKKYNSLINFLIFTENYGKESMIPYLYLAQDEISVLTGDKLQQEFIATAESGNVMALEKMINTNNNFVKALNLHLQYADNEVLSNLLISAIYIFKNVEETEKNNLANSINERIPDLVSNKLDINYREIKLHSLIEVGRIVSNEVYNDLLQYCIEHVLNNGIEDDDSDFVIALTEYKDCYNYTTISAWRKITDVMISSGKVSVNNILKLCYVIEQNYLEEKFGKSIIKRLVTEIDINGDFSNELIKTTKQFISKFIKLENITEVIADVEKCFKYPIMHDALNALFTPNIINEISEFRLKIIVESLFEIDKERFNDNTYSLLSKIPYEVEEDDDFDKYLILHINSSHFSDLLCNFGKRNSFELLKNTIEQLNKIAIEDTAFVDDVVQTIQYFTEEQRQKFWGNIKKKVVFNSTDEYEIIKEYARAFVGHETEIDEMYLIFKNNILSELSSRYSYANYLKMAIESMNLVKDISEKDVLSKYVSYILKAINSSSNIVIAAFKQVSDCLDEATWVNNIDIILNQVNETNFDDVYTIVSSKEKWFNEENDNLKKLRDFYLNNFEYKPLMILKAIGRKFKTIGNTDELVSKVIENDTSDEEGIVAKLLDNLNSGIESVLKSITSVDKKDYQKLYAIFEKSKKYNVNNILSEVVNVVEDITVKDIINCLLYIENYISNENIKEYITLLELISTNSTEVETNRIVLQRIRIIPKELLKNYKKELTQIVVKVYRNTTSTDMKRECIDLVNANKYERLIKKHLSEEEYKEYSELIS